jgi:hypothetical protein
MDHEEALRLQAVVKYVLGELPQAERDSFEEHYFDCRECALDVHATAAFAANARHVFGEEVRESGLQAAAPTRRRLFAWFRPIVAVPAFAGLLIVIAYQNLVTIPDARKAPASEVSMQNTTRPSAVLFGSAFPLHAVDGRRGSDSSTTNQVDSIRVRPDEGFAVRLDFAPKEASDNYIGRVIDSSGREVFQVAVPGSSTNKKVQLVVPAGLLKPGGYSLIFAGDPGAKGLGSGGEVLRYSFSIAFQQ